MTDNARAFYITQIAIMGLGSIPALSEEFGGIEFPEGAVSFADAIVAYDPAFGGGPAPIHPNYTNPAEAIGVPNYTGEVGGTGTVALGEGGRITLLFTNNVLTGSGSTDPDLYIFEVGPDVEDTFVEISSDGITWHSVGKVYGAISSIDIDSFGFGVDDEFAYVRLTDDPNERGNWIGAAGADIDAVGAIATTSVPHVPELDVNLAVNVKFDSLLGSRYKIEESADMENWSDAVTGIVGTGSEMSFCFDIESPKKFYRVRSGN